MFRVIATAAVATANSQAGVYLETLTAIKRAGADMILTYFALEAAKALRS